MITDLIYGLFFISLGAGIIKYRKNVKSWTGNFAWAEYYIGRGGTYLVILVFGLGLIFYGVTYPFGGITSVLDNDSGERREADNEKIEVKGEVSE